MGNKKKSLTKVSVNSHVKILSNSKKQRAKSLNNSQQKLKHLSKEKKSIQKQKTT